MKVRLTFIEELLGTLPGDPELATEFILDKYPDGVQKDEEEALPTADEALIKGTTLFARNKNGNPILWNYQVRGFFKAAVSALNRVAESVDEVKLAAHKKIIDQCVFVKPRQLVLSKAPGIPLADENLTICQRPLRGQTAQGERVSLARSEAAPAGTFIELEVKFLKDTEQYLDNVREWFTYGELSGLGQWRNSGKGTFSWEELD